MHERGQMRMCLEQQWRGENHGQMHEMSKWKGGERGVDGRALVVLVDLAEEAHQLHVPRHDGDALGVDGAEVGVLEETHQEGLSRLLERQHRRRLEAQVQLNDAEVMNV